MMYVRAVLFLPFLLICASCGGGSDSAPDDGLATALPIIVVPNQTPSPTPTPTQSPAVGGGTSIELDPIASNFDTAAEVAAMEAPPSMAPDDVGAFRMTCKPSHNAYDDPIVFPGRPGAAHLHTFFGNTRADAFSTYASLRTTGESTCHSKLNRSAYWIPAMMNGRGKVVMPDFLTVYYKRWPTDSAMCRQAGTCVPIPRGLRMVFGRKMTAEVASNPFERNAVHFNCQGTGAVGGIYSTLVEAAKHCPSGAQIGAIANAPSCWNGTQLDSADHRSHLSFFVYDAAGLVRCPSTHPYVIPAYTLSAWYETDETLDRSGNTDPNLTTWHFASDRMAGMTNQVSGSTYHADWFGAWDDNALMAWQINCIDKLLSCSTGNFGNGTGLKWLAGFNFKADQRLVDPPIRVTTAMLCTGRKSMGRAERQMLRAIRRKLDAARNPDAMLANAEPNLARLPLDPGEFLKV